VSPLIVAVIGFSRLNRSQKSLASWSTADGCGTSSPPGRPTRGPGPRGRLGYRLRQLEQSELLRPPLDRRVEAEVRLELGEVEGLALQPGAQVRPQHDVPVPGLERGTQDRRRLELVAG